LHECSGLNKNQIISAFANQLLLSITKLGLIAGSIAVSTQSQLKEILMAKGMDKQKKDTLKKPEKTLKEKRADKAAKKNK
jgi:hypothetical protein